MSNENTPDTRKLALLSRKFIFSLCVLTSLTVLCWFDHIDKGIYSVGVVTLIGGYLAANVAQKKVTQ